MSIFGQATQQPGIGAGAAIPGSAGTIPRGNLRMAQAQNRSNKNKVMEEIGDITDQGYDIGNARPLVSKAAADEFVAGKNAKIPAGKDKWTATIEPLKNDVVVWTPNGTIYSINGLVAKKSSLDQRRAYFDEHPDPEERREFTRASKPETTITTYDRDGNKIEIKGYGPSTTSLGATVKAAKHALRVKNYSDKHNGAPLPSTMDTAYYKLRMDIVAPVLNDPALIADMKRSGWNPVTFSSKTTANLYNRYILHTIFTYLTGDNNYFSYDFSVDPDGLKRKQSAKIKAELNKLFDDANAIADIQSRIADYFPPKHPVARGNTKSRKVQPGTNLDNMKDYMQNAFVRVEEPQQKPGGEVDEETEPTA